MLKKWLSSDMPVLLKRLLILYLALFICRILFYVCNTAICGALQWSEIWPLLRGSVQFDSISILYVNSIFIVLSLLPFRVRERSWYRSMLFWYYIVVNSIVVAINLADIIYFRYTQNRFSAYELLFANNDNTPTLMLQFAIEHWYLIIAWIAITAGMVWLYRRHSKPITPIRNIWRYTWVNSLILLFALTVSLWTIRGCSFSRDVRPITITKANAYTPSSAKATMILSNPFSILRTMGNKMSVNVKYFPEQELSEIYTPYHYPPSNDTIPVGGLSSRGIMKGRNVVIFILESFSSEHSALLNPDLYPDGKGFTPFLDSLMRQGYMLRNAFATGGKSIDALPSIWGSIPTYKTPFILMPQALREGEQLPKILRNQGYETAFFCGSPNGSMGFDAYAKAAGVDNIYSMDTYHQTHEGNFDGYWGIWDEPFIGYMGEVLNQTKQPFMSTIFTLNSHHPFIVPEQYQNVLPKGKTKIHKAVSYTDLSIRKFFERYSHEPWFNNTTFVFVADHVSSERYAPKTNTPLGLKHIITFFYTPDGILRGDDNEVFQQTDIMPTLLGLMGYDKPYFGFGRDIFNEPERMALAVNYNGIFQGIGNSVSILFDEQKVISTFLRSDTLQYNNISSTTNVAQAQVERMLKAQIQQYYTILGPGAGIPLKAK